MRAGKIHSPGGGGVNCSGCTRIHCAEDERCCQTEKSRPCRAGGLEKHIRGSRFTLASSLKVCCVLNRALFV